MKLKANSGILFTLLLVSVFLLAFNIQPVKASGTIYIRADGSIDPLTANITTVDNVTYIFTADIYYESIVIEKNNIMIDGNGHTLQGPGDFGGYGFYLNGRSGVTIKNTVIKSESYGIYVYGSGGNTISGNTLTDNGYGISVDGSDQNTAYHNNFINNTNQAYVRAGFVNTWDDGCPSGGNYWSNYTGVDLYNGPYQNETGSDGIGDTPHVINANNIGHYPLMGMFSDFPATLEEQTYHVTTVCNSTISAFQFDQVNTIIRFNVTGEEGIGFCRVCIPHALMEPPYTVTIDGHSPQYINYTLYDNGTHRWIYFTYQHSAHEVIIAQPPVGGVYIPVDKFSLLAPHIALTILLTIAIMTLAYVKKRKRDTEIIS